MKYILLYCLGCNSGAEILKKVETYQFTMPKEYKACLDFKDELRASGIQFVEEGGAMFQTITIVVRGIFDKTEDIYNDKCR